MNAVEVNKRNYRVTERFINGREFIIRSIRPGDKRNVQDCMRHLSPQSRYYRFFTPKKQLTDKELVYFTELDFSHHVGLIAVMDDGGVESPIGFAEYIRAEYPEPGQSDTMAMTAEAAFAVEEEYQGQGVATALLKHLVTLAIADGIKEFTCLVLSENRKMIDLLINCGLRLLQFEQEPGAINIHIRLAPIADIVSNGTPAPTDSHIHP